MTRSGHSAWLTSLAPVGFGAVHSGKHGADRSYCLNADTFEDQKFFSAGLTPTATFKEYPRAPHAIKNEVIKG
jgi:hypothetical protein